jgi:methyl-accepting chemotaxis protein
LLDFQESLLASEPRMKSCAAMDRNGYIPVNNKYCSQPQRPGDIVWNTANSRNRRIYDDGAARAASSNKRAYLVQSYWRDMGGGNTVRMREVDVPIWVDGKLWGAFRSTYVL